MKQSSARAIGLVAFCICCLVSKASNASEIDMKVLHYPTRVSRFSDFYVRVKIMNNSEMPLHGCDKSSGRCSLVGWDFVDDASLISLPRKNIVPLLPSGVSYLSPGQAIEKSIRIPIEARVSREVVLRLYLIVKERSRFSLQEQRLKIAVKEPPLHAKIRRGLVRLMVYGYLGLSLIILWLLVFVKRGRN